MRNIPGSIYLPRKHFPTKQKYQQETAERQSRGQFKAHKRTIDCFKVEMQCSFPLQKCWFADCRMMLRGKKGTLHAGVVKKVQIS